MTHKKVKSRCFYPDYIALIGILEKQQAKQHSQRLESRFDKFIAQCVFITGVIGILTSVL